jgi:DNA-binding NtrC family response regulator
MDPRTMNDDRRPTRWDRISGRFPALRAGGESGTTPEDRANAGTPYWEPRAIRIQRQGQQPFLLAIYTDGIYTFGRDPSCEVVFADDSISRAHGRLTYRADGRWVYRDMGSSNGSFLSSHLEEVGPSEIAERLYVGRDYVVEAGESIVLANRAGRISLLAEVPEELRRRGPSARSTASEELRRSIELHARHRRELFLLGLTGSGKTWAARRIHELSGVEGTFVAVNCAALGSDINSMKSELLGHEKGAFSGAVGRREGKLPHAANGTLFLDEVESLSREAQAFLLDLLDGAGNYAPLGAQADVHIPRPNFRLISASKKPLRATGLREDLCNRLGRGGFIEIPGLQERREDIPDLVRTFLEKANTEQQMDITFDPAAIRLLEEESWQDNVRGLEGTVNLLADLARAKKASDEVRQTRQFRVVNGVPIDEPVAEPKPQRAIVSVADVEEQLRRRHRAFGIGSPADDLRAHFSSASTSAGASQGTSSAHASAVPHVKRPKDYSRSEIEAALAAHHGTLSQTARALGMVVNTLKARMAELGIARSGRK